MTTNLAFQMSVAACSDLKALLYLYWILCSGAAFVALQSWSWTQRFRSAVLLSAARGKTWQTRDRTLKPFCDWSVPQLYFWHFYAVGVVATSAALFFSPGGRMLNGLFWIHVARRLGENRFLMKYPSTARMHVFAYLYGLSYYVVVPLSISLPSLCPVRGMPSTTSPYRSTLGAVLSRLASGKTASLMGLLVFLMGSWIQWHSHWMLSQLQKKSSVASPYVLPTGGLFDSISCPHYFGEIVIYCGLTMLSQLQPLMLLINIWVVLHVTLTRINSQL